MKSYKEDLGGKSDCIDLGMDDRIVWTCQHVSTFFSRQEDHSALVGWEWMGW
jgi:hypothetical protein